MNHIYGVNKYTYSMHDIAQKQIFFFKLPELDPDPDLVVKFPDPAKRSGSDRIRIRNTARMTKIFLYILLSDVPSITRRPRCLV
jgi:hypothetical protein